MRKFLLLSTVAFFAATGAASAGSAILTLDGFCNAYKIKKADAGYALTDTGCSSAIGGGVSGKLKGTGKNAIIALTDPASPGFQFEFTFSSPFVTGGTWSLYSTNDGVTFGLLTSGTYTVGAPAQRGLKSVTSK